MRPVLIVVGLVLAQDSPQMVLIPDEGVVQELASASPALLRWSIGAGGRLVW